MHGTIATKGSSWESIVLLQRRDAANLEDSTTFRCHVAIHCDGWVQKSTVNVADGPLDQISQEARIGRDECSLGNSAAFAAFPEPAQPPKAFLVGKLVHCKVWNVPVMTGIVRFH